MNAFNLGQIAFLVAAVALIAERAKLLFYRAPAGRTLVGALSKAVEACDWASAARLASVCPGSFASEVVEEALAESGPASAQAAVDERLADQRYLANHRLLSVRLCATIASTSGLLGAILSLVTGFGSSGLLSLQAGLAEQVALSQALVTMGIGIGTSALCFQAFGAFRPAARRVIAESLELGRAVESALDRDPQAHARAFLGRGPEES